MKAKLMALAAGVAAAWGPAALAQVPQTIDLSQAPGQHITIPGSTQGRSGPPTATSFDFVLQGFQPGRNGAVCAVGTLAGGALSTPTQVSIPVQTAGHQPKASDCATGGGDDRGGFGGEEHGSLENRSPDRPLQVAARAGGLVIPVQFPPPPPPGGCNILNLRLGPINLNLLGLVVQTNTIVLNVTGLPQQGLLGNLLCALLGP